MNECKKIILLVEDEAIVSAATSNQLKKFGYDTLIAMTGEEAVEIASVNKNINLILMDIDLGKGIDGTEAAALILKENDIPVLFLSSHTEPEIVDKTEKITSYGYVVKNSSITVLDASIKMAFKLFDEKEKTKNELVERKKIEEDLRTHQIELKMQNDELSVKQQELEALQTKFFNLFDLAPVSYLTISDKGIILEANLTSSMILGVNRDSLLKQLLSSFIIKEDQDVYYHHRNKLIATGEPQTCSLRMIKQDGTEFGALLQASFALDDSSEPVCRVVIVVISAP
jgi:PAS domain S-box-containing protein